MWVHVFRSWASPNPTVSGSILVFAVRQVPRNPEAGNCDQNAVNDKNSALCFIHGDPRKVNHMVRLTAVRGNLREVGLSG